MVFSGYTSPFQSGVLLEWEGSQLLARLRNCIPRKNTEPGKINPVHGVQNFLDMIGVCAIPQFCREFSPENTSFRPDDLW